MGIALANRVWLRIKFALLGHAVVMQRKEYDERKDLLTCQLALVRDKACLVLGDYNKLMEIFIV